ncbi:hypothetical protein BDK63_001331 [Halomonas campaniensis]|uniref:Outer membrane protein beta-barrel domain-containing protein n=1 Tax=Halomonas campaniensis TaxID=213554 RepID=A0A7W5K1Y7_9GAMM|nr:outer membrane beta-barrel protein [Halomonas campaniensis]MBB3330465.1 hypothetical protein [Halomonas campaniensis]
MRHSRHPAPASRFAILPLSLAIALASDAMAQEATNWTHNVGVSVANEYNDNVFYERENRRSDTVTLVSPFAELVGSGERHEVRLRGDAQRGKYHEFGSENYTDWRLASEGRFAYSQAGSLFGGVSLARGHEERSSPDDVNGEEPTRYDRVGAFVGVNHTFGRITSRVGGTWESLDFDNVPAAGGTTILQDDRDRQMTTIGGRFGYRLSDRLEPFVQAAVDVRDYDDPGAIDRDSEGYNAGAGLIYRPRTDLHAELMGGWMEQDYDDPGLDDISTFDAGAELRWQPEGLPNRLIARLDRTIEETTIEGASGNVRTGVSAQLTTAIRPDLTLSARASYSDHDYRGTARNDNLLGLGMGLRHYLNPHLFVGVDYDFLQRDSSEPAEDFDNNRLMVSLGTQLERGYEEAALLAAARHTDTLGGFYLGLQGGLGEVGTAQAGPRATAQAGPRATGQNGSLRADFRDTGETLGLFGGYALTFDDWRLALELESDQTGAGWEHVRSGDGRAFSVEKQRDVGLGLRVDRLLAGGNAVYGRFGLVRGRFDARYAEGGENLQDEQWHDGRRIGGGLEVPLATTLGLRMDYSYTNYDDIDIGTGDARDDFTFEESLMRLGLAWHPWRQASERAPVAPAAHDGFYLGAHTGYGSLVTDLRGPRTAPTELAAEFGDSGGLAGLHAGYGRTFGRIYLGGEVDAEVSDITWNHERLPNGRTYSVDRESSLGLALRAGYVIDSGALLYLLAGSAWTDFETRYARGQQRIHLDETEQGWRFGGGLEVPVGDDLHLRMELTQTRYDDVEVDYGTGVDRLESEERLMRLGLSYRF